jgi:SAM-dependent methyltransferase
MISKAEFDKFADEYHELHRQNVRVSGESPEFFAEYKIRDVRELLGTDATADIRILDFGAGVGSSVPYFKRFFPEAFLTCLDVSEKSLAIARERYPDHAEYRVFDGESLPFPDGTFDLVFAACVFHHIPHGHHAALLREWHRVLKPKGTAVVFEHNPLNPLTVNAVNTCPFDENAVLIRASGMRECMLKAGFPAVGLRYRLFFPGPLRALRPLERWLRWCPLGAQYFVHASKPEDSRA